MFNDLLLRISLKFAVFFFCSLFFLRDWKLSNLRPVKSYKYTRNYHQGINSVYLSPSILPISLAVGICILINIMKSYSRKSIVLKFETWITYCIYVQLLINDLIVQQKLVENVLKRVSKNSIVRWFMSSPKLVELSNVIVDDV